MVDQLLYEPLSRRVPPRRVVRCAGRGTFTRPCAEVHRCAPDACVVRRQRARMRMKDLRTEQSTGGGACSPRAAPPVRRVRPRRGLKRLNTRTLYALGTRDSSRRGVNRVRRR